MEWNKDIKAAPHFTRIIASLSNGTVREAEKRVANNHKDTPSYWYINSGRDYIGDNITVVAWMLYPEPCK